MCRRNRLTSRLPKTHTRDMTTAQRTTQSENATLIRMSKVEAHRIITSDNPPSVKAIELSCLFRLIEKVTGMDPARVLDLSSDGR